MKKTKFIFAIIISSFLIIPFGFAKDDGGEKGNPSPSAVMSLYSQLHNEISDVLSLPVYLAYKDKNLTGDAYVTMKVENNGKLSIVKIFGNNQNLNNYVKSKISSRNIWTPEKYAGKYMRYKIHVK